MYQLGVSVQPRLQQATRACATSRFRQEICSLKFHLDLGRMRGGILRQHNDKARLRIHFVCICRAGGPARVMLVMSDPAGGRCPDQRLAKFGQCGKVGASLCRSRQGKAQIWGPGLISSDEACPNIDQFGHTEIRNWGMR